MKLYDNLKGDISVTDITGINRVRLTNFSDSIIGDKENKGFLFNISSDGSEIIFLVEDIWEGPVTDSINNYYNMFKIYMMETDGSNLKDVYKFKPFSFGIIPKFGFSLDRRNFIFIENISLRGIYSLNLAEKVVTNLTDKKENWADILDFTFTPDGKRIVFVADIYPKFYVFHALILRNIRAYINYYLFRKLTSFYDNKYLCIMDIDGKNYRRIAKFPMGTELGRDFIHWEQKFQTVSKELSQTVSK